MPPSFIPPEGLPRPIVGDAQLTRKLFPLVGAAPEKEQNSFYGIETEEIFCANASWEISDLPRAHFAQNPFFSDW
jgi:hypothetical protein